MRDRVFPLSEQSPDQASEDDLLAFINETPKRYREYVRQAIRLAQQA